MNANASLVGIEARRSTALWFSPIFAALTGYVALGELPAGVWLWPHTSVAIQDTLVLIGPLAAGLSAWAAARNRRWGIGELLATTPLSTAVRELMTWAGTAVWMCLGYVLAAAFFLLVTLFGATWGSPVPGPVLAGLSALCMHSAVGYAIGYLLPRLFTALLVALLDYVAQGVAGLFLGSYLSPVATPTPDAFYGVFPAVSATQTLWFFSVSAAALGFVALMSRENLAVSSLWMVMMLAFAAGTAALLVRVDPSVSPEAAGASLPDYKPVCEERGIAVCVHPAYEKLLPEVATTIDEMTQPLVGISGGPVRAAQKPDQPTTFPPGGTVEFYLYDKGFLSTQLEVELAYTLVQSGASRERSRELTKPQSVIAASLVQPVSDDAPDLFPGLADEDTRKAFDRYSRLLPRERRTWLEQNYSEVRAGELDLADLP